MLLRSLRGCCARSVVSMSPHAPKAITASRPAGERGLCDSPPVTARLLCVVRGERAVGHLRR